MELETDLGNVTMSTLQELPGGPLYQAGGLGFVVGEPLTNVARRTPRLHAFAEAYHFPNCNDHRHEHSQPTHSSPELLSLVLVVIRLGILAADIEWIWC